MPGVPGVPGVPLGWCRGAAARVARRCLWRMVRWTVRSGVRQFLDVGAGFPVSPELHTVAQDLVPGTRVL